MTEEQVQLAKEKIDKMTRYEMASLWRFAPFGHPYFDSTTPLADYFKKRFDALGGFSPSISKALG